MNPYWWQPPRPARPSLHRIDVGGIFVITTKGVTLDTEASQVLYGLNPCEYNALPCESLILLKVHADVPTGGEAFQVHLTIPANSTIATTPNSRMPIVDSQGTPVTGSNVSGSTERLLYLNKRTGTARFVEFKNT